MEKGPCEIGAVEHRLEEIGAFEMGAAQIGLAEPGASEIGVPKVCQREIETAQIEPRKDAPDKSGASSCSARHEFHAAAPSLISPACSSFAIVRPGKTASDKAAGILVSMSQCAATSWACVKPCASRRSAPERFAPSSKSAPRNEASTRKAPPSRAPRRSASSTCAARNPAPAGSMPANWPL